MQQEIIPFKEALRVWIRVALQSFGGPAGQIAVMHKILVEEKKWISEQRFLHALNYCMLLPGPEAQQLATYIGWLLHKTKGGLVAGLLFIVPGFVSILVLSLLYASYKDLTIVQGLFYGIKPAVLAIVIGAVLKIGKRALKNNAMYIVSAFAFIAIFFFHVDFPYIVIVAGLAGYIIHRFDHTESEIKKGASETLYDDRYLHSSKISWQKTVKNVLFYSVLWALPFIIIVLTDNTDTVFLAISSFFSKIAVVTFGGAYSVLAYIAQKAVSTYGWLQAGEMLDGLGMAETTPGPLIQVVQFVGFMGAYRIPGSLDPIFAGIIGSILATWVTFVPCFFFIFTGAPYIEYLRDNKKLSAILSGITAAVVGVIFNLSIWFSINTLFKTVNEKSYGFVHLLVPDISTLDIPSLIIALIAIYLYLFRKVDMIKTILICSSLGIVYYLFVSYF